MKILVLCNHGNVRSVALAYLIKTIYKHEAIAVGISETSKETQEMLFNWADKIITLYTNPKFKVLPPFSKMHKLDVGEDVWHNPFAQELQHKLLKHIKELEL